jgi:hypothetical protein
MVKSVRTAGYGPVSPVVWEGGGREAAPYPNCRSNHLKPWPYPLMVRNLISKCALSLQTFSRLAVGCMRGSFCHL